MTDIDGGELAHKLEVERFPDTLRHRLGVVARQQKTTMRAIIIEAVDRDVAAREHQVDAGIKLGRRRKGT